MRFRGGFKRLNLVVFLIFLPFKGKNYPIMRFRGVIDGVL